jgi:hypothetical protein
MKTYKHQNLVHAAIKGVQIEMLEFLIKGTSKQAVKEKKDKNLKDELKYKVPLLKQT